MFVRALRQENKEGYRHSNRYNSNYSFFLTLRVKTDALSCMPDMERAVYTTQIPAIYLQLVSKETKSKDRRKALREKSQVLLPLFLRGMGHFMAMKKRYY